MREAVLILLLVLSSGPAGSEGEPVAPIPDGTWKGTTSQGEELQLRIRDGALSWMKVTWRLTFERACRPSGSRVPEVSRSGTHVMNFQVPVSLNEGKLNTQVGVGRDLDLVLEGTFEGEGQATGTIEISTIDSSPCHGREDLTWKAKRS